MGDIVSFTDRRKSKKNLLPLQSANRMPEGGIQMEEGADLADLLATWASIRREIDTYRRDLRLKGGVPFCDM
ncbi:hypothetical protein J5J10_08740 [Ciceribacter sp. L1K23]|uniref:hypothetical protein n=1 Tax=Ciceribacter sp. L1K23 TaxID=2820276 RepID=UPI001B80F0D1|nr:hypothetical protein [Ciceribacter sp. L1K23]MBR0555766.1 hypothetical protein [Ciceribacter sp. L1K23]